MSIIREKESHPYDVVRLVQRVVITGREVEIGRRASVGRQQIYFIDMEHFRITSLLYSSWARRPYLTPPLPPSAIRTHHHLLFKGEE